MLAINIEDVISVLNTCKPYLIGLAVVLVLAIVAMVACRKMARSKKFLIRGEAALAMVLAIAVTVNLICFGPMSSMISLAMGDAPSPRRPLPPPTSCARPSPKRASSW